ncbi:phosphate/phosphite/phosphonate ABC transporter substrate-binding protein [Magnetofaba australis]|uniref:Putative ABC-type phosphate/phosphonate transport system n=1 Tax=Magnetofaba australis IT-1 TaxID=1434232 RepID=A0A1Y2K7V0_9PROT|nr:phosphate/phosphite/phosphonate ABC transporter substrate-binding protein [Magnetofaba australis]OSM06820.1 putative ABC-type phosphate/phosphonate transport system [Magnetofaba australis IT-1]
MFSSPSRKVRVALLGLCMALLLASAGAHAAPVGFSFGVVPQFEPRKLANIWLPILRRLEARTGFAFHLDGAARIPEFEQDFMRGDFDFAYMNPYHALLAIRANQYKPLARDYARQLYGVLVVKKGSPITELSQLQGKRLAFPSPNALGASLLMRTELIREHGLDFKPIYVKTHSSVYLHVLLGRADAGGGVMSTLQRQKPQVRDNLRVLYRTRSVNPHPIMAHNRISEPVRQAVQRALLAMGEDEKDRKLLSRAPILQIGPATLSDYAPLGDWGLESFYERPF